MRKPPTRRNPVLFALAALQRLRTDPWSPRIVIDRQTFWQLAWQIDDFRDGQPGYEVETCADVTRLAGDYGFMVRRLGNIVTAMTINGWHEHLDSLRETQLNMPVGKSLRSIG